MTGFFLTGIFKKGPPKWAAGSAPMNHLKTKGK